jgi:hypothetical protein
VSLQVFFSAAALNKILSSKDKLILAEKKIKLKKSNDIVIKDKAYNSMQEVYKDPLGNPIY